MIISRSKDEKYITELFNGKELVYSDVTDVIVNVELDKENEDRAIFKYKVDIVGEIDEKAKKRVLNILKNCPVRKTLSKKIEFEYCEVGK